MLCGVALVSTGILEDCHASTIRVTRILEWHKIPEDSILHGHQLFGAEAVYFE
jgi:hypothetical protein